MNIVPWWSRLPSILGYAANSRGLLACVFLGIVSYVGDLGGIHPLGFLMRIVASGLIFSAMFLVVRESANGHTDMVEVQINDVWDDAIVPGIKSTILGLVLALPVIYCLVRMVMAAAVAGAPMLSDSPPTDAQLARIAVDAGKWLVLAIGFGVGAVLVYPICFIVLAIGGSLRMALFPYVWITILSQVFLPYLGLLVGIFAILVVGGIAGAPLVLMGQMVPILPDIASRMVAMYFGLAISHLLGWFVFQYHERLGYKPSERQETLSSESIEEFKKRTLAAMDAQGAKTPGYRGGVRVGVTAPPVQEQPAPSEDEIAGLNARFSAACGSKDGYTAFATAPALLDAYWQVGNDDGAHWTYRALLALDPDAFVDPDRQLRLARELEAAQDYLTAATAWRALALRVPDHPAAPKALFRCAECYGKGGRADWAKRACEILLQRYPMSSEAGPAQARMRSFG